MKRTITNRALGTALRVGLLVLTTLAAGPASAGPQAEDWTASLWQRQAGGAADIRHVLNEDVFGSSLRSGSQDEPAVLALPWLDGTLRFAFRPSPTLAPEAAAAFPQLASFRVAGVDDPSLSGRATWGPGGLRVTLDSPAGVVFLDPRETPEGRVYVSSRADVSGAQRACRQAVSAPRAAVAVRDLRLALSTTGEFARANGGSLASTMEALVALVDRIGALLEREAGVRLVLIDRSPELIALDPARDAFDALDAAGLARQNAAFLARVLGPGAYDVADLASGAPGGLDRLVLEGCSGASRAQDLLERLSIGRGLLLPQGGDLSVADATSAEGNSLVTSNNLSFLVQLSAASASAVTVDYATADGTATSGTPDLQSKANTAALTLPDRGVASLYPSTVTVPPLNGSVQKVTVKVNGIAHTFPQDIDMLLVAPGGRSVVLMSDAGGAGDVTAVDLTFDDAAAAPLTPADLVSGTYKPTNIDDFQGADLFPIPASSETPGTTLASLNGIDPAGPWTLYVVDDAALDSGSIAGGWSVDITTTGGDYVAQSGTLTFAPGETAKSVMVPIWGDTLLEPDETMSLNLSNPSGAAILDGSGQGTIQNDDSVTVAFGLAQAMFADTSLLIGATFVELPPVAPGLPHAVFTGTLTSMPTNGNTFAIMTTGDASLAPLPNTAEDSGLELDGGAARGDTDRDVSVLRIDFLVPDAANCLSVDFKFFSEEFREFVGTEYNDAFIAELDQTTWSTQSTQIVAPDNFAFDPGGNVVSINATGPATMSEEAAAGTTYDGATQLLRASKPVTTGVHSLFISIFDQFDHRYDSAVFLDNLFVGTAQGTCTPGATALNITKVPAQATSTPGGQNSYTITIANPTAGESSIASIIDELPTGFVYRPGTTTGLTATDPTVSGQTLTWTGPFTLPASGSVTLAFGVLVANAPGEYFNSVRADAGTAGIGATGPTARIQVRGLDGDLAVTINDSPDPVTAGSTVNYLIAVKNNGTVQATNVTVTDVLPAGVTFVSASASCTGTTTVTCAIGNLAGLATTSVNVMVTATAPGSLSNTASAVASSPADPNTSNNSATATTTVLAPGTSLDPLLVVEDMTLAEGGPAAHTAQVTIRRTGQPRFPATVSWTTADGTAAAGVDYQAASGSLTLPIGTDVLTVAVPVLGNHLDQGSRTFHINLSGATGATIADSQATVTLVDDDLQTPADFDGNATSEVAVFRSGAWLSWDYASGNPAGSVWTGTPGGCIPTPADYDGDARIDRAQFCAGTWYFYRADGSLESQISTGSATDIPVPADFDGDGADEAVVFRAGAWMTFDRSNGSVTSAVWTGLPAAWLGGTSIPVPADVDGDGDADFTIYSQGPWHVYNHDGSYRGGVWTGSIAGDVPVPGDYDGDGKEELTVFRAGAWLMFDGTTGSLLRSVWTGQPAHFTGGVSQPAPIDRNGDGVLDLAVYSGGPYHFFAANGSYLKGIWTGSIAGDLPISRRLLP